MKRAMFLFAVLACLYHTGLSEARAAAPNLVIILADDLGYGDLGCYGHPTIRTPRLDRMAQEGLRFTEFYSAAEVCTPSRAALLTGRYPIRSGMAHDRFRVLRRQSAGGLPASELTLPELLREKGYATACIGKWHLGVFSINPDHHPLNHGFDYFFGLPHSNDMDPTGRGPKGAPSRLDQDPAWWNAPLYRNRELVSQPADQTALTRRYTEEAVQFIRQHKKRPFLLYLAHSFPHVPLFASGQFRTRSARGLYGDVVEELDASVGSILDALRREGLEKRTLVVFTSDNGPWLTQGLAGGSAGLLRDGKGSTWDGGMRVPAIAWWPGTIPAGRVSGELVCMMDLFTTGLSLAGASPPPDRVIDGLDISRLLKGKGPGPRESFFFYRGTQLYAARVGPYKAHFTTRSSYGPDAPQAHTPPLLFDLRADPSESVNIASNHLETVDSIGKAVEKHRQSVLPATNQLEALAMPGEKP